MPEMGRTFAWRVLHSGSAVPEGGTLRGAQGPDRDHNLVPRRGGSAVPEGGPPEGRPGTGPGPQRSPWEGRISGPRGGIPLRGAQGPDRDHNLVPRRGGSAVPEGGPPEAQGPDRDHN